METTQNKIVKAALLGAGTVGSGVYELVKERQKDFPYICGTQIEIAKILVRDASKEREGIPSDLLTDSWEEIIADDSISIIIEVMGGIEPAKSYLLKAMKAGKQVVTANKDLIAEHGHELLDTAEKYGNGISHRRQQRGALGIQRPVEKHHVVVIQNFGFHRPSASFISWGLVVIMRYSSVFLGKWSTKGRMVEP